MTVTFFYGFSRKRDVDKVERQYHEAKKKWNEINKKIKGMQTRINVISHFFENINFLDFGNEFE
jgi:wobble nucleotide-excising tRNase